MILRLKSWESRSPPGLPNYLTSAGWSSPVARQAHNLKAAGSNPAPATKSYKFSHNASALAPEAFFAFRVMNDNGKNLRNKKL